MWWSVVDDVWKRFQTKFLRTQTPQKSHDFNQLYTSLHQPPTSHVLFHPVSAGGWKFRPKLRPSSMPPPPCITKYYNNFPATCASATFLNVRWLSSSSSSLLCGRRRVFFVSPTTFAQRVCVVVGLQCRRIDFWGVVIFLLVDEAWEWALCCFYSARSVLWQAAKFLSLAFQENPNSRASDIRTVRSDYPAETMWSNIGYLAGTFKNIACTLSITTRTLHKFDSFNFAGKIKGGSADK